MLWSEETEHPRLTNREISESFQLVWSRYLNVTDRQADHFAIAILRYA